jgi:hypothetical protein
MTLCATTISQTVNLPRLAEHLKRERGGRSRMGKRRNARCSGDVVRAGPHGVPACSAGGMGRYIAEDCNPKS